MQHMHEEQDDQRRFDRCNKQRNDQLSTTQVQRGLKNCQPSQEDKREEDHQKALHRCGMREPVMLFAMRFVFRHIA